MFIYEIETRLFFKNKEEAFKKLPDLREIMKINVSWETTMFGPGLHKADKILRFSRVWGDIGERYFIGYKERDIGKFCNIRQEINEEITETLDNSRILEIVGIQNQPVSHLNFSELVESHGYSGFMSFAGSSLMGKDKKNGFSYKLMHCEDIKYPFLLEIEKTALTIEEALIYEKQIIEYIKKNGLFDMVVRDEPTTLLYKKLYQ